VALFALVWAGIRRRLFRSLTSVATVGLTLAVLTLTVAGLNRVHAFAAKLPEFLAVVDANAWLQLPLSYAARLAQIPGVQRVEYYDTASALDPTPEHKRVGILVLASDRYMSTSPDEDAMWVTPEIKTAWDRERQGLVSNATTAASLHWTPGELIQLTWVNARTGQTNVSPFRYVGDYEGAHQDELIVHYDYVNELLPEPERNWVSMLLVFRDKKDGPAVDRAAAEFLKGVPEATKTGLSREVIGGSVAGELGTVDLLEKLALIMLLLTCSIVGATVSMSLRERRAEIGTLRAVGFTRAKTFRLILGESTVVAMLGYAAGVVLPIAVLALLGRGIDLGPNYMANVRPGGFEAILAAGFVRGRRPCSSTRPATSSRD
jgi:putative ABC transport system permease protein